MAAASALLPLSGGVVSAILVEEKQLVEKDQVLVRIDGSLRPIKTGDLSADTVKTMIYSIMTEEQRSEYEAEKEIDFAVAFGQESRFRVNAYTTTTGAAANAAYDITLVLRKTIA